jgi:uncharacterized membrane protein
VSKIAVTGATTAPRTKYAPDRFERLLAYASIVMLLAIIAAVVRGHARWGEAIAPVWGHLATIAVALGLTPVMLLRARGDHLHRVLGWLWVSCLFVTALISFDIRQVASGQFSYIHVLSGGVVVLMPLIIWTARTHRIARHRRAVRGTVLGALLIAGFFTFPFHRMLGSWLFS